ncbi:lysine--tRNA ligase [Candidatus Uhrbacteria bacterium]|nr:lysine--tRNA ligase [Candidatus Uhrbacteria bacterium]
MIQEEKDRLGRLTKLRAAHIDPYPTHAERTHTIQEVLRSFDGLLEKKTSVKIIGRVRLLRRHGGLTFAQLQDQSGTIQVALRKDILGEEAYDFFHGTIDVGDFLEVGGQVFLTKKGEKTVEIERQRLISKSLLPLPEKWHGLSDVEARFRKRYLDLIMSEEVRNRLETRSKIISSIRSLLDGRGFLEVETPTLQPVYGGGFARPFVTHHHALDTNFFLRISDEMYLKRLLVGGFEKVYEITKVFRNEGLDRDHNPEFTMFEAQVAYENYEYGMDLFEEIFETAAVQTLDAPEIQHGDVVVSVKRPWKRLRLIDAVEQLGGLQKEIWSDRKGAQQTLQKKLGKSAAEELARIKSTGELMAFAFETLVEEKLFQPTIIYDYPVEVSPLAKKCPSDSRFVERFEAFAVGMEIGNNYSELNDPVDLERRFMDEKNREQAGFDEAHQTDTDYLEAIKHGMPPACGLGIGIDRMVMLLTGAKNIKEVIWFPTLRPNREGD